MAKIIDTKAYLNSLPLDQRADAAKRINQLQVPSGARLVDAVPAPKEVRVTQKTTTR